MAKQKYLILLGATGSIGTTTLALLKEKNIILCGFSYFNNERSAQKIINEFPNTYAVACPKNNQGDNLSLSANCQLLDSNEKLIDYVTNKLKNTEHTLYILNSIVGTAGFLSTLYSVDKCDYLLLANKESLVVAGHLVMEKIKKSKRTILLPIDSEHCSLFRLIENSGADISSYTITASGGSLRDIEYSDFDKLTKAQVLNHPTWNMGQKITVDSAGLVNKALELIEAHFLFDIPYEKLHAVIHPQSFIHALVSHKDSSMSLHASSPNMSMPIAFALDYPNFKKSKYSSHPIEQISKLEFSPIDLNKFPSFSLGLECGKKGGNYSAVFNIANDIAVELFLNDKIKFTQIYLIQSKAVKNFGNENLLNMLQLQQLSKVIEETINENYV